MADARLFLWDLSVAVGIFGFGSMGLRLLKFKRPPLAVSGCFGVSLWIALGGYLNLLHLLRSIVFFILVGTGVLLALIGLLYARKDRSAEASEKTPLPPLSLSAKLLLCVAVVIIGLMMLGAMRPLLWCFDDLQGYLALGVKAAQTHSIQPDPFCERRVQAGVGGGNFLDALMFATGDLRAMNFIDSTFGLFLYALALWAVGRRWKVPPAGIAFALLCLPFATLIKINLTIIYLSAAGFLVSLLLVTGDESEEPDDRFSAGRVIALGMVVGGLLTTKTPNLLFVLPFLIVAVLLYRFFKPHSRLLLWPLACAFLVAVVTFIPYSIANKTNAGTYLYPLLGQGIHISGYHLIPTPAQTGIWQQLIILLAPNTLFLFFSLLVVWKLTSRWEPLPRAAAIAYLFAILVAVPITVYGLGGEGADRYTAPLVMPALLLTLLIVIASVHLDQRPWRRVGIVTLSIAGLYTAAFIGIKVTWYLEIKTLTYEAFGRLPYHHRNMTFPVNPTQMQQNLDEGASIQASLPPGATAIALMSNSYIFDFHRNTIYIADFPGMATPPPGLPLDHDPSHLRQFLLDHGVHYIIYDHDIKFNHDDARSFGPFAWDKIFTLHADQPGFKYFLLNEKFTHKYGPWETIEYLVSCRVRDTARQIVDQRPSLYNDGHITVTRID